MRKTAIGVVTRDKAQKTRRVEVPRLYMHPKYGKIMKSRTICHVHDEKDEAHVGDLVEIIESRPRSRLKRWDLVRIVERSTAVAANAEAQAAAAAAAAAAAPAEGSA